MKEFLKKQYPNTEISIGYVKSGKVDFRGLLRTNDDIIEIDNSDSLFEIGSINKVFTTNVLAQLIQEGKVKSDDLISNFLPQKSLKSTNISLKRLANHTSGLPRLPDNFYTIKNYDEKNPYLHYDEMALIDYLENYLPSISNTESKFEYSNLGSGLLGYVISKIENAAFEKVVKKRIFEPLQMNASSFDINQKKNSVIGLNKDGQPSDNWEGGILSGCIGIISSAKDMTKFMCHILDTTNEAANLQLSKTHKIDDNYHIGLGWGIKTLPDGSQSYNHGGGSDGYSCYMKLHRASESGVIILTNVSAFNESQGGIKGLVDEFREILREIDTKY